jgi:hypothetical protein
MHFEVRDNCLQAVLLERPNVWPSPIAALLVFILVAELPASAADVSVTISDPSGKASQELKF